MGLTERKILCVHSNIYGPSQEWWFLSSAQEAEEDCPDVSLDHRCETMPGREKRRGEGERRREEKRKEDRYVGFL